MSDRRKFEQEVEGKVEKQVETPGTQSTRTAQCGLVGELLEAYADGELDAGSGLEIDAALGLDAQAALEGEVGAEPHGPTGDGAGAAPGVLRDLVEAHLQGCSNCRRELRMVRAISSGLGELPILECPPGVAAAVQRRRGLEGDLDDQERNNLLAFPALRGPAAVGVQAAALLLAVAAGLVVIWLLGSDQWSEGLAKPSLSVEVPPEAGGAAAASDQLRQAEEDLRYALAYFGGIAEKAGLVLRDEVLRERIVEPPRRAFAGLGAINTEHRPPSGDRQEEL